MNAADPPATRLHHRAALAQYRRRAAVYDLELKLFEPARRAAIERLALRSGEVVFDVGCGTGLSLPLLRQAVGAKGHIVGIEQSPEMMALARQRVRQYGWRNITLIEAPVAEATMARSANAALCHFTHDILRDPAALAKIVAQLRPGARVVACGLKWAPPWAWPVNLFVFGAALRSVSSLAGLSQPWSLLAGHLSDVQVETLMAGAVFLASGVLHPPASSRTTPPSVRRR